MPELPEVETTLRGISAHIKQQTIAKAIIRQYQLRWPIPANIQQLLANKSIAKLERRGKYILLRTNSGTIIIHLGMSGNLRILTKPTPPKRHEHLDLIFHNNKILRFTDPRRFGAFLWVEGDPYEHPLLRNLGVEPLTKEFSGQYLLSQAKGRTIAIKTLLMNNAIVTGVGNIYAAEALFASCIYPAVPAKSLSIERLDKLVKCIKLILRQAIKRGGTTLKDFVNSEGKPGYFSSQLKVYGRNGSPCMVCGKTLERMLLGQRSTVYCGSCQR